MRTVIKNFPRQKLTFKEKDKKWRKTHLDWADTKGRLFNETVRKRMHDKKVNVDFYNGIIHKGDMAQVLNPGGMDEFFIPDNIQHYPIIAPRIDVLVGEEASKKFDWTVRVINPTSISLMEDSKKQMVDAKFNELLQSNLPEEEIEKALEKFSDYVAFEYQDIREKRANELMKHYVKQLNVKGKFSIGMKDALIHGEEGYVADIRHGEPTFEILNPMKSYVIQHGSSSRYQDASIILLDDYWSPGKFIDTYHDELEEDDIDYILGKTSATEGGSRELDGDMFREDINDLEGMELKRDLSLFMNDNISAIEQQFKNFNQNDSYFDSQGNIRVLRIFWRSYKQIKVVSWFDAEGDLQVKYRNEDYVPVKELGETVEVRWVTQWWQGVKAGKKVYVDMRPRPIQYNKIGNPGYNTPGVVGRIYTTNDQKVVSLLDRAKPFNYIFNAAFLRLLEAYSKYFGPLLEIDKAKMPEGWGVTKTLYFAKKAGVIVVDSFKEGNKGNATGKLAGAIGNTTGKVYNSDISGYIQQNINMMEYAKAMMDEITGVPKQRLGTVEKRETVGGVDTAIRQSNYVTEMIFKTHDEVKRECLMLILETAKIALKGNRIKLAYIASDYSNQLMDIDGDDLAEDEYGLDINNDTDNSKLEQNLDMLAQAALQNQTLSFSTLNKIYTSPSLTEIQRLIEKDEKQLKQDRMEQEDANRKSQEAIAQGEQAIQQEELRLKELDITERSRIEELKLLMTEKDEPTDNSGKEALDYTKHREKLEQDMIKIQNDMKKHRDQMELKKKDLEIKKTAKKSTPSK